MRAGACARARMCVCVWSEMETGLLREMAAVREAKAQIARLIQVSMCLCVPPPSL